MRNKSVVGILGFVFLFASYFTLIAQNSDQVEEELVFAVDSVSAQKKISNDSLLQIAPIDTSFVREKSFQENFAEKYTDDEFNYESGGGQKSLLQKIKEWINNLLRNFLGLDKLENFNKWSDIFLKILYVIIFLAVIYVVVRLVMNHKGRWFFEKKNQSVEVNLDNVEEHIHEADFETMIRETEQAGDTRQSIRLYYLWLLKTYTDNGFIEWHPQKTNSDYQNELKDEKRKSQFRYLSYLYNYIWYGEFSINDEEYRQAREAFINQLKPNGK